MAARIACLFACACAHSNAGAADLTKQDPACHVVPAGHEDLAAVLEPLRTRHHLPALGAAIVTPDKIEALGVVGVRAVGNTAAACVDDAFHLGSDSKALSAVVIAKLVEQNALAWNTRIGALLGDLPKQNPAYAAVTLEQLLAHRAGLAHDPVSVSNDAMRHLPGDLHAQREAYAAIALSEAPVNPPGSAFLYSNAGYVLAGLMAERATHKPWEALVREHVFAPLAMSHAGFGPTASAGHYDGLWAHLMHGDAPEPIEPGPDSDNPLLIAPAGSVHTSIAGWARFIQDALAGLEGRGALLSSVSYAHLFDAPFGGDYAHGWARVSRPALGGVAYMHAGSNTLNSALAWLAPKLRVAVIVATNAGSGHTLKACDEVVGILMKPRVQAYRAAHN
jgi:CubicO group peptidase (beta-lactamase class C family)